MSADALIVTEKLKLVQQLNENRINIQNQIQYYKQQRESQADQLHYTFFNLTINKDVLLDWKEIKQTWKNQVKFLINSINSVIQGLTVILAAILVRVIQGVVYFFLAMLVLKGMWIGVKRLWGTGTNRRK